MAEVAAALEGLSGDRDKPIVHASALNRLKTWSTGIFSSMVRPARPRKAGGGSSAENSSPKPDAATLADP
jgi:hypothetical protein